MNGSRYGKNGWKIALYKIGIVIVMIAAVGAVVTFGASRIRSARKDNQAQENAENNGADAGGNVSGENLIAKIENEAGSFTSGKAAEPAMEVLTVSRTDAPSEEAISQYFVLPVSAANATSTISQQGTSNDAILLFDGKENTSWQEGANGYGIGESVSFSFDRDYNVRYISFKLGNWKNDKYYYGNAKPKTITVSVGDFSGQVTFTGERMTEWAVFSQEIYGDSMKIQIDDVYQGTTWEDTCISEITVYGR